MIQVFEGLPLELDPAAALRRLRLRPTPAHEARVREALRRVAEAAEPRALVTAQPVGEQGEDWLEAGGVRLRSRLLVRHVRGDRVFPYVVTLGRRLDELVDGARDAVDQYCLHEVASLALSRVRDEVRRRTQEAFGAAALAGLAPGSLADWPLREQVPLFGLLGDVEGQLGVRLTDSCLMVPRKTLSGVFFESETGFVACRLCDNPDCPARQAAYDPTAE